MKVSRAHLAAIFAFSMWGLFPIYWKFFSDVPAWDLFGHRLLWSFVTLFFIMLFRKKLSLVRDIWADPKKRIMLVISALLISSNWLLYIYGKLSRRPVFNDRTEEPRKVRRSLDDFQFYIFRK